MDARQRQAIIDVLGEQGGGQLHGFFTAHGLGTAYENPQNKGWGRAKKVADALAAADRRGDMEDVLQAASAQFGMATPSGATMRPPAKVRHDLDDLATELVAWEAQPPENEVQNWIDRLNDAIDHVAAHVGDEAPDPVALPDGAIDSNERLTPAGRARLEAVLQRAQTAMGPVAGFMRSDDNNRVEALHPRVRTVAEPLLAGGHGDNAVEEACKVLAQRVGDVTGLTLDGTALMNTAFSVNKPLIALSKLSTESEKSEQQGVMQIATGLMLAARNPRAHRPASNYDEAEVFDLLATVSLIHRVLDRVVGTSP